MAKNILVVSAHAADFVWRAGGTMAKYIKRGDNVSLVVLSYGVRGESNHLWKLEGQTSENVKRIRREESEKAAKILGISDYEYWDFQDYPIEIDDNRMERMVRKIREVKPDIIITHSQSDAFNPDHEIVSDYVWKASVYGVSAGVRIDGLENIKQPKIFGFEHHQTEISSFVPDTIIDITDTFDTKVEAMKCFQAQKHLIDYYTDRGKMRGNHARRISGNKEYQYAETFTRRYPYVGEELL
ncbi:PIG-L deacetylase family protein [Maledivibacter halophilus]|uniref:4-oxalomesaconate hydratase n=1 Tax=Maledivibacter halophilus TaxID=36842 RepID=A0A1T5IBQ6_9FIRM|nr:PIG-L deacetylase family protein [Maledivibacter halophilus]SKC36579.1 4-oxalomesaconate hydratase [Maledivibacter halophilus]